MANTSLYRGILKKAWQITWSRKELWILGFFATFLGISGVLEVVVRAWSRIPAEGWNLFSFVQTSYPGAPFVSGLLAPGGRIAVEPSALVPLIIILAIFVALLWFVASSEAALVWTVRGGKKKLPTLEESFAHGRKYGWRLVGLHVLSKLLLAALFLMTSLPLFLVVHQATYRNALLYFISFIIFFPLVLIVSFMTIYAVCGIVLRGERALQAFHTAWDLFRRHWLISIETTLVLFVVNLLAGLVLLVFALLLSIPVSLLAVGAFVVGSQQLFVGVFMVAIILLVLAALFIGSIVTTLQLATWTLLYGRLRRRGALAKLTRILRAIPKFIFHRA